jgi:hypothetical protein
MENHIKGSVNDVWKVLLAGSARDLSDLGLDCHNRFAKNQKRHGLTWAFHTELSVINFKALNIYLALAHQCHEMSCQKEPIGSFEPGKSQSW